jgi:Na+-driven multidrug efflux pump
MGGRRSTLGVPLLSILHLLGLGSTTPCSALPSANQPTWRHQLANKTRTIIRLPSRKIIGNEDAQSVNREILKVSFFSFLHNAAMPFADLVDGSFLSTLDANSLGAVGVVRASHNSVSKLYNSPLSKTTISLIASSSGERKYERNDEDPLPTAVSSALAVALLLGSIHAFLFVVCARQILSASGIEESSAMFVPAMAFMRARAWSAPTSTLWLVATNTFRGLGDASTPLVCSLVLIIANLAGDYLFIEKFQIGIAGTALGTTIAQFVALVPLLILLNRKVAFWMKINLKVFGRYLAQCGTAGVFLVGRSMARIAAVSYVARRSVRCFKLADVVWP